MNFVFTVLKKYNSYLTSMGLILSLFLFLGVFSSFKDEPKKKVKIIVIDPGHGGKDPGCNGVTHKEKEIALAVALKFGKLIEENMKDVKVIYTRKTDVFVDLEDRAKIANDNNADLFISIHCNAAGKPVMVKDSKTGKMRPKTFKNSKGKLIVVETSNPVPYGSETYVMGLKNEEGKMRVAQRENSVILLEDNYETKYQGFDPNSEESYIIMSNYTASYVIQSAGLALKIQEEYSKKAGRVDKGVHRQSIWVLWRTAMPSVLTEIGYLTNPQEEIFLGSEKGQNYMASSLFRAFRRYKDEQEDSKKNYNDEIENQAPLEKEIYALPKDSSSNESEEQSSIKKQPEVIKKDSVKDEKNKTEIIPTTQKDSEPADKTEKEVTKNDIIKNFKEKNKKDSIDKLKEKPVNTPTITTNNTKNNIVFKVQFASSDKEIADAKAKFPKVTDVTFYKYGEIYKYTSGNYSSMEDASKQQAKLRELGYKDCFVVAFKNNVRIDINEARKQVNSSK